MKSVKVIRLAAVCALLAAALVAAGCGSSDKGKTRTETTTTVPGTTISAPGLQTSRPPWRPERAHLVQRIRQLGLPPAGTERFHIHALLRIYVNGLLTPVPTDIGIDHAKDVESSLHTHDGTGIIHMEASKPHTFTLGDFFTVWGVKLGPAQVGGLTGLGGDRLHFFLNGRPLRDPAAHVLKNHDRVVIGYGAVSGFPHDPGTELFRRLESANGGALACGTNGGRRAKSCLAG